MFKKTYDFLMPNGMLIPLQLSTDTQLDIVKDRLFEEAKKYPAYELVGKSHQYVFGGVTLEAETEEFRDESLKLLDLPLYLPILTLTLSKQHRQSLQLQHDIGRAMGISADYLDTIKAPEIQDFRRDVGAMCQEDALERQSFPETKRLLFYYPPILDINPNLPKHIAEFMKAKRFLIKVYIYNPGEEIEKYDVQIDASWTPSRVVHEIIFQKYTRRMEEKQMAVGRALRGQQLYVLKVCTSEEYMLQECCLYLYKYIRHCITWDTTPELTLVLLAELLHSIPREDGKVVRGTSIEKVAPERQYLKEMECLLIYYPPVLDVNHDLPIDVADTIKAKKLITKVYLDNPGEDILIYDVEIDASWTPRRVVNEIIFQKYMRKGVEKHLAERRAFRGEQLYVLQSIRIEEYMLRECCLHSYKYIRHCITWNKTPELKLVLLGTLLQSIPKVDRPPSVQGPRNEADKGKTLSSWDLDGIISIKVDNVTGQRAPPFTDLRTMNVSAAICHGSTLLCKTVSTAKYGWHQAMNIDIMVSDLPRSTKLCLSLCTSNKTVEYWVNIQLFDHKGKLVTGQQKLPMWPGTDAISQKHETVAFGITGCNPDDSFPTLEMEIISPSDKPIMLPSDEHIRELIRQNNPRKMSLKVDKYLKMLLGDGCIINKYDTNRYLDLLYGFSRVPYRSLRKANGLPGLQTQPNVKYVDLIKKREAATLLAIIRCVARPVSIIHFDKWTAYRRLQCFYKQGIANQTEKVLTKPKSLPKLLTTVDWSKRTDVFELYKLLSKWPKEGMTVLTSLQLLDDRFPDLQVEQFAVDCLGRLITDEELLLYLMQLTQALKFRSYIDGPLTRFLLERSLQNRRTGNQFFWHLRSELHSDTIRFRFAPILEVYCRNCGPFLSDHLKEVGVLNFCCHLAKEIKSKNEDPEMDVKYLKEQLETKAEAGVLSNTTSIFGKPQQFGEIWPEKCGIFRSKMRPLTLTWKNPSPFAKVLRTEHFSYIFKHGDDIRQDMLCIQLLQVIDNIWKYEGLDCCLTNYGCMSMGNKVGMIEMVQNAKTIANIKSERGAFMLSATGLNGWLHENNRDCYEKAVKRFTHSCAGYAVATFVLGISDRHSDNIMVKTNGELFHIDFGHFLGNRKAKFGIKRERVPFVMIEDFIQVITKGVRKPHESEDYKEFVLLCIKAYMALWKNADLLLTLFYLMRNSGLPELVNSENIQFVRQALAVDKDETKAAAYFLENFNKAYNDSWTTKLDWIFHAINQYKRS